MQTYFTSDFHIKHSNIIKYCERPFINTEEMAREIIARHNSVVNVDDIVYNLGDFSLDEKYVQPVLSQLHGTQYLIAGNHDTCHARKRKHERAIERYLSYGFKAVYQEYHLNDQILLHHLPYEGDSKNEARYLEYRPKNEGKWLLHGHTHSKNIIFGKQIHVGVDAHNFTPISFNYVMQLINEQR